LYIEINSNFTTNAKPASSSFAGYHMAFPYEEEEGFCTNDPDWPKEAYNWLESVKTFPIGGSMGVNYSESVMGYLPKRMERGFISFTGELRESIIPSSGVVEELEQNSIEVLFGVYANRYTGEWIAYTIGVYNTQNGCVLSQEDDDALHDFGLETTGFIGAYGTGPYGCVVWDDSYTFEPLALYTDITGNTLDTDDMSNFTCVKTNDWVGIKMISEESGSNNHSPATMAWKCRITKNS
jgi:hypothetical protein